MSLAVVNPIPSTFSLAAIALAGARAVALVLMLVLPALAAKACDHATERGAHSAIASPTSPHSTSLFDDVCCAGCPCHGWRDSDQVASDEVSEPTPSRVVFQRVEMIAPSRAIPPPTRPPRTILRVADAG